MATPGFGFSVGDFIAALDLMVRVTNSLRDGIGAASEYQSLVRDLANLESALTKMQSLEKESEPNIEITSLQNQRHLIQEGLEDFLKRTTKFKASLGDTAPKGWKHGTTRKVQWATFCSKEIMKLRTTISSQVENLNLLNSLQILEYTQDNKVSLEATARLLQEKITDVERTLSCAMQSISISQISRFDKIESEIANLREASQSLSGASSEASQCLVPTETSLNSQLQTSHNNLQRSLEEASKATDELLGLPGHSKSSKWSKIINNRNHTNQVSSDNPPTQAVERLDALEMTLSSSIESVMQCQSGRGTLVDVENTKDQDRAVYDSSIGAKPLLNRVKEDKSLDILSSSTRNDLVGWLFEQIMTVLKAGFQSIQGSLMLLLPIISAFLAKSVEQTLYRNLPQLLQDSIRFEDAPSRVRLLPYDFFRHWEVFQAMLCCEFKGLPGETAVQQGMYAMVKAHEPHNIINKAAWPRLVWPGSILNMSVVLEQGFEGRCPRCLNLDIPQDGNVSEQYVSICNVCNLEYHQIQVSSKVDFDSIKDAELESKEYEKNKDLESFKRVHLLPELVPDPSSSGGSGGGVRTWYCGNCHFMNSGNDIYCCHCHRIKDSYAF